MRIGFSFLWYDISTYNRNTTSLPQRRLDIQTAVSEHHIPGHFHLYADNWDASLKSGYSYLSYHRGISKHILFPDDTFLMGIKVCHNPVYGSLIFFHIPP